MLELKLASSRQEVLSTKSKLTSYKKADTNPIAWSFQGKTIFKRLNLYIQRLNDIRDIFQTANEFSKLDRVEIGGLKGRIQSKQFVKYSQKLFQFKGRNLSRRITDATVEYQKLYSQWSSTDFDPLDADGTITIFQKIQQDYQDKADGIERSLAQIFIEAFDDCHSTAHCLQVEYLI